ncbi:MAG: VWA domain-containing protein [Woeseia sp.]
MPAEFHLLRPEWLWALPPVVLAIVLLAQRRLSAGSWQRVVDPALVPYVLSSSQRHQGIYRWWLVMLGAVLAITALAGPAWNRVDQPVFRSDQALVIALDLSRSMDAQDLTPSRLVRARLKILDILDKRSAGQTALVVYSSNAFTVTPLTTDADTVAALVNSVSTDIMPSRGSYPVAAIAKARQLLDQAGSNNGEVLLIADGGSSLAAEQAARDLQSAGYRLSVLAVGTPEGAPIPRAEGGFVTDRSGQIAVPRLESEGLEQLAEAGGGRYSVITTDDEDIERLLAAPTSSSAASDDERATDQWREEGPWLLLLLVPLAALAFRRGWVLVLVVAVLPFPQQAQALTWSDLWKTPDQQASALLAEGDAEAAAERFENSDWQAVARYRAGQYAESAEAFSGRDDATALYNLGNSLARMSQFDAAIEAYDKALEIDPTNDDAIYNRALLKDMRDAQDSQSNESQDNNGESGGEAQQSESDSQSDQSGDQGSEGSPGEESESDDSAREREVSEDDLAAMQEELERAAQEAAEQGDETDPQDGDAEAGAAARRVQEQEQAMEQWLRRIPNDPGGLLRRKFRYQYQREGRDQDGNNVWPDDEVKPW